MKKINITESLTVFQFAPDHKGVLGTNIYTLCVDNQCILIDSGYEKHFLQVKRFLDEHHKNIVKVINTHYHPDHNGGLDKVGNIEKIGSKYAEEVLSTFYLEYSELIPTLLVDEPLDITFGEHHLRLKRNHGHSKCSILITLDDTYLFVGDDVMTTNEGELSLPYCASTLSKHMESLYEIEKMSRDFTLLLSHGVALSGDQKQEALSNSIKYLAYCLNPKEISYEAFIRNEQIDFVNEDLHLRNIEKK